MAMIFLKTISIRDEPALRCFVSQIQSIDNIFKSMQNTAQGPSADIFYVQRTLDESVSASERDSTKSDNLVVISHTLQNHATLFILQWSLPLMVDLLVKSSVKIVVGTFF